MICSWWLYELSAYFLPGKPAVIDDLKIVLIGPMRAGKSTIAPLLADQLDLPRLEMDELRWSYYPEVGYDEEMAREIYKSEGTVGVLRYSKPFEAYAVENVITQHNRFVLDLGAGHSVYEDEVLFRIVKAALAPLPHVFLLLPQSDLEKSSQILNRRFSELLRREVGEVDQALLDLNEHYVKHPSNHLLATRTFYTNGKRPHQTCSEIIDFVLAYPAG